MIRAQRQTGIRPARSVINAPALKRDRRSQLMRRRVTRSRFHDPIAERLRPFDPPSAEFRQSVRKRGLPTLCWLFHAILGAKVTLAFELTSADPARMRSKSERQASFEAPAAYRRGEGRDASPIKPRPGRQETWPSQIDNDVTDRMRTADEQIACRRQVERLGLVHDLSRDETAFAAVADARPACPAHRDVARFCQFQHALIGGRIPVGGYAAARERDNGPGLEVGRGRMRSFFTAPVTPGIDDLPPLKISV